MMKKTLVALALAATTVSGSAMAWTANGTSGSLQLGGTLTPEAKITPWEVLIGSTETNLNKAISGTAMNFDIPVVNPISILGIRTQVPNNQTFSGAVGIAPQINYSNAVDLNSFNRGVANLVLDIYQTGNSNKIGQLSTKIYAVAEASQTSGASGSGKKGLIGANVGDAFYGGLGKQPGTVDEGVAVITTINPQFTAHYNDQGVRGYAASPTRFNENGGAYSGFYGAGIKKGENIRMNLTSAIGNNPITWKASLPITVSYQ